MKWKEVNGEAVCDCDPICDNCERRFRCLDAGPANSILQGKRTESRRFDTISELQKMNDRLTVANAKLRQVLEEIVEHLEQPCDKRDDGVIEDIAHAALKEEAAEVCEWEGCVASDIYAPSCNPKTREWEPELSQNCGNCGKPITVKAAQAKEEGEWTAQAGCPDLEDAFAAGRALGRREMKGEVKQIMHDADMAHVDYESSWYQAKDAIEAIPEEV